MKVVIVAKTRMENEACIGALAIENAQSIRILRPGRRNHPLNTPYDIGQIWEMEFTPCPTIKEPHIEDVIVSKQRLVGTIENLREFLLSSIRPWMGAPRNLYGGSLRHTWKGSAYINHACVPDRSTWFWIPDRNLEYVRTDPSRIRYKYQGPRRTTLVTYKGLVEAVDVIPANSLVRISLARWWRPEDTPELEERCYLQLSGWY